MKMCATCPHRGVHPDRTCHVSVQIDDQYIDELSIHPCHENQTTVCRGSVLNKHKKKQGLRDDGSGGYTFQVPSGPAFTTEEQHGIPVAVPQERNGKNS